MKIVFDPRLDYADTNYYYYGWEEFETDTKNLLYAYGIHSGFCEDYSEEYKNRIYFLHEEPNGLYHSSRLPHDRGQYVLRVDYWTKLFMVCPYTVKWFNDVIYKNDKFVLFKHMPVCGKRYYPNPNEPKIYDFFYQGSIHSSEISSVIDVMTKYKYVWTSLSDSPDNRKTHIKTPFADKIKLLSQSKMAIEVNALYEPYPGAFTRNITQLPNWNLNEAFSHIDRGIMPQFKVKTVENMMCKTLVLMKRYPWKLMEEFGFEEGEHFLYFDEISDIPALVQECLSNWNYCENIIDKAYNKVMEENSTEAIYNKYFKPYDE